MPCFYSLYLTCPSFLPVPNKCSITFTATTNQSRNRKTADDSGSLRIMQVKSNTELNEFGVGVGGSVNKLGSSSGERDRRLLVAVLLVLVFHNQLFLRVFFWGLFIYHLGLAAQPLMCVCVFFFFFYFFLMCSGLVSLGGQQIQHQWDYYSHHH